MKNKNKYTEYKQAIVSNMDKNFDRGMEFRAISRVGTKEIPGPAGMVSKASNGNTLDVIMVGDPVLVKYLMRIIEEINLD